MRGVLLTSVVVVTVAMSACARTATPRVNVHPAAAAADCTPPGAPSSTLTITTQATKTLYDSECYAATANAPLTITFTNDTRDLSGDPVGYLGISIYPSQEAAYTIVNGDSDVIHAENALFVGTLVAGGGESVTYSVPALPVGTYWMQDDSLPTIMHASLVVEE